MESASFLPWLNHLIAPLAFLNGLAGVILLALLTGLMAIIADWRVIVAGIILQSIILTVFATRFLPPEWAFLRLMIGTLIAMMWFLSAYMGRWGQRPVRWLGWRWPSPSARGVLRLVMVGFIGGLILFLRIRLPLYGLDPDLVFACTWLVAMGTLVLALGNEPLTSGIGLIWWLEALHLYYPALERDAMIEGTIGTAKLLVGLVCAYLMTVEGLRLQPDQRGER